MRTLLNLGHCRGVRAIADLWSRCYEDGGYVLDKLTPCGMRSCTPALLGVAPQ